MDFSAFFIFLSKVVAIEILSGITRAMLYQIFYRNSLPTVLSKKSRFPLSFLQGGIRALPLWGLYINWGFFTIALCVVVPNILLIVIEQILVPKIHANS